MKTLVVIPARGGSKGLPKKNIKILGGKPLIHYTIDAAREIFEDTFIYISTDSEEIKKVSEETGLKVPFIRPDFLATDTAGTQDVILHAIKEFEKNCGVEPENIVLLQPTSPLRTGTQIKEALNLFSNDVDMVVSVKETDSNPYYVLFEESENGFLKKSKESKFIRRQDCPKVWEYNGAIYIMNTNSLKKKQISQFEKVIKYEMCKRTSVDIDDIIDFRLAEIMINDK